MVETVKAIAEVTLLGLTLWREARGEPFECKLAVARSILNRVHRPSWWGSDILSVVTKRWQYSSLTDPKDRQLTTWPTWSDGSWISCMQLARDLVHGAQLPNPAPGADSYYDTSIPAPKWATAETFVKQIGRIRFHNLDHDVESEPLPPAVPLKEIA